MSADLHPIAYHLTPLHEGEVVAFREDHPEHPGMYGRIVAIGTDQAGNLAFDLDVYNPSNLKPVSKKPRRSTLEDIQ